MKYELNDKVYRISALTYTEGKTTIFHCHPLGQITKVYGGGYDVTFILPNGEKQTLYCNSFHLESYNERMEKEHKYFRDRMTRFENALKSIQETIDREV